MFLEILQSLGVDKFKISWMEIVSPNIQKHPLNSSKISLLIFDSIFNFNMFNYYYKINLTITLMFLEILQLLDIDKFEISWMENREPKYSEFQNFCWFLIPFSILLRSIITTSYFRLYFVYEE